MNEYLEYNKICFQEDVEKAPQIVIWVVIFITLIGVSSSFFKIRLSHSVSSIYNEETKELNIIWPCESIDKLNEIEKIEVNKNVFDFQIKNISEINIDEKTWQNYQIVSIQSPVVYLHNQIVEIKMFDKKEKIIVKLKKIMLGG